MSFMGLWVDSITDVDSYDVFTKSVYYNMSSVFSSPEKGEYKNDYRFTFSFSFELRKT